MRTLTIILITVILQFTSGVSKAEEEQSEEPRNFQVMFEPFGLNLNSPTEGFGVGFGYRISDDLAPMVFLAVYDGTSYDGTETTRERFANLSIRSRYFWSETFNSIFGIAMSKASAEMQEHLFISKTYEFEARTLYAVGSLGNHWKYENLLVGCDWITIYFPISSSFSREESIESDDSDRKEKINDGRNKVEQDQTIVLRFNVTWMI